MKKWARLAAAAAISWPLLFLAVEGGYRAFLWTRARLNSPPGAFELYVVGGSSGGGAPYGVSIANYVSWMFDGRIGQRRVAVANLAEGGASIYPEYVALARRLRFRDRSNPAIVLIYSGHNEKFGAPERNLRWHRLLRAFKRNGLERSMAVRDLTLALEKQFDSRGIRDMEHYERYLRKTIEASLDSGATPVLATQIGNTSGVEPGSRCNESEFDGLRPELESVRALERRRPLAAASRYTELLARAPCLTPELFYRRAKSFEAAGRYADAHRDYWTAVDLDPNQHRARSDQNMLVRRLAAEYRIPLVDAVKEFEARSPHGIAGSELFSDIMHPNAEGYRILALAFARRVSELTGEPVRNPNVSIEDSIAKGDGLLRAHILSGAGLLAYLDGCWLDEDRLALAERHFRAALGLAPDSFSCWFGLGLVEAERRAGLLQRPEGRAWLGRHRVSPDHAYCLREETAESLADELRPFGVEEQVLDKIRAYRSQAYSSPFCRERLARPTRFAPEPPRDRKAAPEEAKCRSDVARLLDEDRGSEAAEKADRCLKLARNDSPRELAWELGQQSILRFAAGRNAEAKSILEEAWKLWPEGLCEAEWPHREKIAPDFFDFCLSRKPREASLYVDRGVALFLRGDRGRSIADFRKALKIDPSSKEARSSLDEALRETPSAAVERRPNVLY